MMVMGVYTGPWRSFYILKTCMHREMYYRLLGHPAARQTIQYLSAARSVRFLSDRLSLAGLAILRGYLEKFGRVLSR